MYRLSIFYKNIVNLEKIAYKDKLTGVKNRAAIFKEIPSIMKKKSNFKIIFLDLDKFKLINDTFGHDMGDKYLIQFANKCEEIIEHKGEIYRIGGDEFVIIIDSDSTDDCLDKIEQLHWEMFELRIHFKGVSIGIASYPEDGQSIEELIFVADRKMYRDKRQRQDCCK